jgi:hypothetical protein
MSGDYKHCGRQRLSFFAGKFFRRGSRGDPATSEGVTQQIDQVLRFWSGSVVDVCQPANNRLAGKPHGSGGNIGGNTNLINIKTSLFQRLNT